MTGTEILATNVLIMVKVICIPHKQLTQLTMHENK